MDMAQSGVVVAGAVFHTATAGYDCSSVQALPPTDLKAGRLRRQFLERLAELIANQQGGKYVAATAMFLGPNGVRVQVTVGRNDKLREVRPADKQSANASSHCSGASQQQPGMAGPRMRSG